MARTGPSQKTPQKPEVVDAPRNVPWMGILVGVAVIAAVAALILFDPQPPGEAYPDLGNFHLADPEDPHAPYNSTPASSGPHFGGVATFGTVFEEPVPEEIFVHNLEDGGIVFTYDCPDGCDDLVEGLSELTTDSGRRILTPYDGIASQDGTSYRAAAAAWTRVFYFDELDGDTMDSLDTFIDLYEGVDNHAR